VNDLQESAGVQIQPILLRGAIYQALALGFAYPSDDVREQLIRRWSALTKAWFPWPDGVRLEFERAVEILSHAEQQELEREHVRLFGPAARCPLNETAYGEAGRLLGRSASLADISGFYLAFGLEPTARDTHPEDHLSLELEFMSLLALKEAYAIAEGWNDQLAVTREAQRAFVQDHLGTWIDALAAHLGTADPHPYYAALAQAVQHLVRTDTARLKATPQPVGARLSDEQVGGETFECPLAARQDSGSAPCHATSRSGESQPPMGAAS
jgi:DMSO reductase family type II enzyme chaperone